jgi:hypothetical protein
MDQDTVVTNLRIKKSDWLQIRAAAAESGMSANEYVNYLLKHLVASQELIGEIKPDKKMAPIWKLKDVASSGRKKPKGLSSRDKVIYGED